MKGRHYTLLIAMLGGVLLLLQGTLAWADNGTPQLREDHPQEYIVKSGDSLWSISARFLRDPWRWPEVWEINPDIANPNLIYPGDRVVLRRDGNGQPRLRVERTVTTAPAQAGGLPVVRLSPKVRVEELEPEPVPVVNMLSVRTFVKQIKVLNKEELKTSAYVQASAEKRLLGASAGDLIYVGQLPSSESLQYGIYQLGNTYRNHKKKVIGYELVRVATAKIQRYGSPSVLRLETTSREVREGDLVFADVGNEEPYFIPHAAPAKLKGRIISVIDGVANIGQYQMVTLDMGSKQGVEPGHIFLVARHAEETRDPRSRKMVKGYDQRAGILLVYQVYDGVSFALVMEADRPMHIHDTVLAPQP